LVDDGEHMEAVKRNIVAISRAVQSVQHLEAIDESNHPEDIELDLDNNYAHQWYTLQCRKLHKLLGTVMYLCSH
jgi:hypothetical protein